MSSVANSVYINRIICCRKLEHKVNKYDTKARNFQRKYSFAVRNLDCLPQSVRKDKKQGKFNSFLNLVKLPLLAHFSSQVFLLTPGTPLHGEIFDHLDA